MTNLYLPSNGAADWRRLLADPIEHWETGYSAKTLASCWEAAEGLPKEIADIMRTDGHEPELLLALPEYKGQLLGAALGASQNDIFALMRIGPRTIAATIEGKVDEPFAQLLSKWVGNTMMRRRGGHKLPTCGRQFALLRPRNGSAQLA